MADILLVEDDADVRRFLELFLSRASFRVRPAQSGEQALGLYAEHRGTIDLVLLDVRMPGLDGPQTLAALREVAPRVRCCFMTGDPGGYTEEGLRALGRAAVVRKPFRLADVAGPLREAVNGADP